MIIEGESIKKYFVITLLEGISSPLVINLSNKLSQSYLLVRVLNIFFPPFLCNSSFHSLFIERVINKLFREERVKRLLENIKDDYLEWVKFEKEIESFKKSYNFTFIQNYAKYYSINYEIFQGCFDEKLILKIW